MVKKLKVEDCLGRSLANVTAVSSESVDFESFIYFDAPYLCEVPDEYSVNLVEWTLTREFFVRMVDEWIRLRAKGGVSVELLVDEKDRWARNIESSGESFGFWDEKQLPVKSVYVRIERNDFRLMVDEIGLNHYGSEYYPMRGVIELFDLPVKVR